MRFPKPQNATNDTTNAIIRYLHLNRCFAKRVNTSGIPIMKDSKVMAWRKSKSKGAADIRAICKGYSIDVEVKTKDDKQSGDQKVFEQEVKMAGGEYWAVGTFDEFYEKFVKWCISKQITI